MEAREGKAGEIAAAVEAAVGAFGDAVKPRLAGPGEPEDQMRGPLETLLASVATALGVSVVPHGETSLSELRVRPDYAIAVGGALIGYIEVKAPGKGADPTKWAASSHDYQQWTKIKGLPNVLYTDGTEWALYLDGERVGNVVRLSEDVRTAGAALRPTDNRLAEILTTFLQWKPLTPTTIFGLVKSVAGLCRVLRDEVVETLAAEKKQSKKSQRPFTSLAKDWRELLFPRATDFEFADGYAQTVTFALLLARVDGVDFTGKRVDDIASELGKTHSLMGRALDLLTDESLGSLTLTVDTLLRVVGVVDWGRFAHHKRDPYLYLYEHFLDVYDPELRKETGSYYTPPEVVDAMARLTEELLQNGLDRPLGFASDDVVVVDPAMGTGTYLLNIIERAAETTAREEGEGAVPARMQRMSQRTIGFEIQTGPYAVAELRAHEAFARHNAKPPKDGLRLYVADTLDNPWGDTAHIFAAYEPIARSRKAANRIKRDEPVLVVIGNPPYRDKAKGWGGWIEQGDKSHAAPLDDFRAAGKGRLEYVLSNLYVYFWRWATWKVFDHHANHPTGVISFITTTGFYTGPGFAGMREYLRRTADEIWAIDLTPEGHRPPVNSRPFPKVQQPLGITIAIRYGEPDPTTPARIHYTALSGTRADKFAGLGGLRLDGSEWSDCGTDWQAPFSPAATAQWAAFPALIDLFPWQDRGCKPNRSWVYAPLPETLRARWETLSRETNPEERRNLLKVTSDLGLDSKKQPLPGQVTSEPLSVQVGPLPKLQRVGYRSFDHQYLIADRRVIDRPRPDLWRCWSEAQVYITEQHDQPISDGPALTFTGLIPDEHHYAGRGGRAIPLYKDAAASIANVTPGLLAVLSDALGLGVTDEDVLAYVAAVAAHPAFTERFAADLETPGVRVPLTRDPDLWCEAVALGRRVVWLHSRGSRYVDPSDHRPAGAPRLPDERRPRVLTPIPTDPDEMPSDLVREGDAIRLGDGLIGPVSEEVAQYSVAGMNVLKKWAGYRKKRPAARWSSPLSDIIPTSWPAEFTTDLLDLIQTLQLLCDIEGDQSRLLGQILTSPLVTVTDLTTSSVLPPPPLATEALPPPVATGPDTLPFG